MSLYNRKEVYSSLNITDNQINFQPQSIDQEELETLFIHFYSTTPNPTLTLIKNYNPSHKHNKFLLQKISEESDKHSFIYLFNNLTFNTLDLINNLPYTSLFIHNLIHFSIDYNQIDFLETISQYESIYKNTFSNLWYYNSLSHPRIYYVIKNLITKNPINKKHFQQSLEILINKNKDRLKTIFDKNKIMNDSQSFYFNRLINHFMKPIIFKNMIDKLFKISFANFIFKCKIFSFKFSYCKFVDVVKQMKIDGVDSQNVDEFIKKVGEEEKFGEFLGNFIEAYVVDREDLIDFDSRMDVESNNNSNINSSRIDVNNNGTNNINRIDVNINNNSTVTTNNNTYVNNSTVINNNNNSPSNNNNSITNTHIINNNNTNNNNNNTSTNNNNNNPSSNNNNPSSNNNSPYSINITYNDIIEVYLQLYELLPFNDTTYKILEKLFNINKYKPQILKDLFNYNFDIRQPFISKIIEYYNSIQKDVARFENRNIINVLLYKYRVDMSCGDVSGDGFSRVNDCNVNDGIRDNDCNMDDGSRVNDCNVNDGNININNREDKKLNKSELTENEKISNEEEQRESTINKSIKKEISNIDISTKQKDLNTIKNENVSIHKSTENKEISPKQKDHNNTYNNNTINITKSNYKFLTTNNKSITPQNIKFINHLMGDLEYVLSESLTHITEINIKLNDLFTKMKTKYTLTEDIKILISRILTLSSMTGHRFQFVDNCFKLLKHIIDTNVEIVVVDELITVFVKILNCNLKTIVGPTCSELVIKNPFVEQYRSNDRSGNDMDNRSSVSGSRSGNDSVSGRSLDGNNNMYNSNVNNNVYNSNVNNIDNNNITNAFNLYSNRYYNNNFNTSTSPYNNINTSTPTYNNMPHPHLSNHSTSNHHPSTYNNPSLNPHIPHLKPLIYKKDLIKLFIDINKDKLKFNPKELLRNILLIYIEIKDTKFIKAVCNEGMYFNKSIFLKGITISENKYLLNNEQINYLKSLLVLFDKYIEVEEDTSIFIDPLTFVNIKMPIKLLTSNVTIDKSTYNMIMLNDGIDPFNREPLDDSKVVVDVEMLEKMRNKKGSV